MAEKAHIGCSHLFELSHVWNDIVAQRLWKIFYIANPRILRCAANVASDWFSPENLTLTWEICLEVIVIWSTAVLFTCNIFELARCNPRAVNIHRPMPRAFAVSPDRRKFRRIDKSRERGCWLVCVGLGRVCLYVQCRTTRELFKSYRMPCGH